MLNFALLRIIAFIAAPFILIGCGVGLTIDHYEILGWVTLFLGSIGLTGLFSIYWFLRNFKM